jgi:hypothetical protein
MSWIWTGAAVHPSLRGPSREFKVCAQWEHRKLDGKYHSLLWDVYDRATKSVVRRTVCLRGINRRRLDYLYGGDSLFPIYPQALTVSVLTTSERNPDEPSLSIKFCIYIF